MANNFNYLYKYIIIGDASVGKSNILLRFCNNKFTDDYQATRGVEFGARNIEFDNNISRIQIWDTAGQECFHSITRAYYKNSVCAIIVYDITNQESFNHVKDWVEDVQNSSPKTVLIVLIGNKIDLEDLRVISTEQGQDYADKNGFIFMETSAKTGQGVDEIFLKSAKHIENNIKKGYYDLKDESCGIQEGNPKNDVVEKKKKINLNKIKVKIHKKKEDCCKQK